MLQLNKPFFSEEVERTNHTKQSFPHHKTVLFLLGNKGLTEFPSSVTEVNLEQMKIHVTRICWL